MSEKKKVAAKFSNFEGFLMSMHATGNGHRGFVTDAIYVHDTLEIAEVIARSVFGDPPDSSSVFEVYQRLEAATVKREEREKAAAAEESDPTE